MLFGQMLKGPRSCSLLFVDTSKVDVRCIIAIRVDRAATNLFLSIPPMDTSHPTEHSQIPPMSTHTEEMSLVSSNSGGNPTQPDDNDQAPPPTINAQPNDSQVPRLSRSGGIAAHGRHAQQTIYHVYQGGTYNNCHFIGTQRRLIVNEGEEGGEQNERTQQEGESGGG